MNIGEHGIYREGNREWRGTVVDIHAPESIALFELDKPMSFMNAPWAIAIKAIDERMYLRETSRIGYGLRAAMEDAGALPAGHFEDVEERIYLLDQPMDIRDAQKFCKERHPGEKLCWLQGAVMRAVPIDKKSKNFGTFEVA
jgi:hypothetical protein